MLQVPLKDFEDLKSQPEHFFAVSFKKGEQVYKQGAPYTHMAFIEKGLLKVYFEYMKKKLVLTLLKPGETVGSPGYLNDGVHHFSVTALERSKIWLLDIQLYTEKLKTEPGFALNVIRYLNQVHIKTYRRLMTLTLKSMYGRVADALLYLAEDFYQSDVFDTTLNRNDLADIAGLSMESVVRILSVFSAEGLIICEGKHFEILDREKLAQME